MDRERQKRDWELKERQREEARIREEEVLRRQQDEMQHRLRQQEEEMHRRQQENTMFMQEQQQQQQQQPPNASSSASSRIVTPTATATSTTSKATTTAAISGRPSIANATNIDTLLVASEKDEKMVLPPEAVQDKISFIFNNLSQINLSQKCDELRDIITEEHWPWVAQYLVMKRASIEPNFHTLYSNFLDTLKVPEINRIVVYETFRNIKVLLRSDKGIANFSDRSLLKNLGHWLGLLMLAKNRPILQVFHCRFID